MGREEGTKKSESKEILLLLFKVQKEVKNISTLSSIPPQIPASNGKSVP